MCEVFPEFYYLSSSAEHYDPFFFHKLNWFDKRGEGEEVIEFVLM